MNRRNFLSLAAASTGMAAIPSSPLWAGTCGNRVDPRQCDPVGTRDFLPGSNNRAADCTMEFRLRPDIQRGITRDDGTLDWVLRLVTFWPDGRVRWTISKTIRNTPIHRQGVYLNRGVFAFSYFTCDEYTGWQTTGALNSCGVPVWQSVNWSVTYRQLDALEAELKRRAAATS